MSDHDGGQQPPGAWSEREHAFKRAFDAVERHIERRWALPVSIGDVLDPNTGDFNGAEIRLDYALDIEMALFVLGHLFGHTAQWTTNDEARRLGLAYASSPPPPELLPVVREYEREASRLAIALFHDAGVRDLDGWLSDWAAADWAWLERFYTTGERGDFRAFHRVGTPILEPVAIPRFVPQRWESRYSF